MEKLEWPHLTAKSPIQVEVKLAFGKDKIDCIYPVCRVAHLFAKIAKTTRLTPTTLRYVKALGYELDFVAEQLNI
jgi:hypothetical protein